MPIGRKRERGIFQNAENPLLHHGHKSRIGGVPNCYLARTGCRELEGGSVSLELSGQGKLFIKTNILITNYEINWLFRLEVLNICVQSIVVFFEVDVRL